MNSKDRSNHKPAPSSPANDENCLFKTCFSKEVAHSGQQIAFDVTENSFRNAPKYSDLTISCGNRTWQAHRVIVCSQSDFFERACSGGFMESESRQITLEDEPYVVDLIMTFFYMRDFFVKWKIDSDPTGLNEDESDTLNIPGPPEMPLTAIAMVYVMADKYAIHGLKELAVSKTEQVLGQGCWQGDFARAVKIIWTSTPASQKGIRNQYLRTFLKRRESAFGAGANAMGDLWTTSEFLQDAMRADWESQTTGKSLSLDLASICRGCKEMRTLACPLCASVDTYFGHTLH